MGRLRPDPHAIIEAGKEFDLKLVGSVAYSTANVESAGSVPNSRNLHRQRNRKLEVAPPYAWVHCRTDSDNIEDFYNTPFEIGYGRLIDWIMTSWDEALKERRTAALKVSLEWNAEDLAATQHPTRNFPG